MKPRLNKDNLPHYSGGKYSPLYYVDFDDILSDPLWGYELSWLYKTMKPFDGDRYFEEDLHIMCFHLGNILENRKQWLTN